MKQQKKFTRFVPTLVLQAINDLDYERKDDLYCIVDMIYRKSQYYKTPLQKMYGYVEIPNKVFKTLIADNNALSNALNILKEEGIIDVNEHYSVGSFCKGYKISADLLSKKMTLKIKDTNINKRIEKAENERRQWTEKRLEFSKSNYYKNFKIDYEAADAFIHSEALKAIKLLCMSINISFTDEEINEILSCTGNFKKLRAQLMLTKRKELHNILNKFINYQFKIMAIRDNYLYFKRNETNQRLDTNLTNLPSTLRQFIKSDETLYNIDFKNSQPYFLYCLLKNEIVFDKKELARYGQLVVEGNFYEYLGKEWEKHTGKQIERAKVKSMLFKIFFSKVESYSKIKEFFGKLFPNLMEYINNANEKSNAIIANRLSTIESTTIISVIIPELGEYGIKPFTIHDSFVCKESEIEKIVEVVNNRTKSMYGISPNLHVKTLIEDSILEAEQEEDYDELPF